MLKQEFEDRVGITVSGDYYYDQIEPEYMKSNLDKDAWCKQWKRNHGIQKVINYEQWRADNAVKEATSLKEKIARYVQIVNERDHTLSDLRQEVRTLQNYKKLVEKFLAAEKELLSPTDCTQRKIVD